VKPVSPRATWVVARAEPYEVARLQSELGVGPVLAAVLAARGMTDPGQARRFLFAGLESLYDPGLMAGMEDAVGRVLAAVRSGERICVYGDYDVDGMAGAAILVDCLRRLGADVGYYVPDRLEEGYGLNADALRELARRGARLVITVDCGVAAVREAEVAARLGLDLVITDHHTPGCVLPRAVAVLDPLREGCGYPFKHLAGAGVVFKLVQSLIAEAGDRGEPRPEDYLELVALGTVADIVPLTGENRVLVRAGLAALSQTTRPGLRALVENAGLADREITAGHVSFALGPRLNATGRVGRATTGVELLLTTDRDQARELAGQLEQANRERQAIEARLLEEAQAQVAAAGERRCLVLAGEGWHPGVLGIAASKLVERYCRPAILLALEGETARGSARSVRAFDICEALRACEDLLTTYGGHPLAAGLTLPAERVAELADRLEELAAGRLDDADLVPRLVVDAEVPGSAVDLALAEELALLGPCGYGNPHPVLALRGVQVREARVVGNSGRHLQLRLRTETGGLLTAVAFNMGERLAELRQGAAVDLAFTLHRDRYNGRQHVALHVRDAAVAGADWSRLLEVWDGQQVALVLGPDGRWAEEAAEALAPYQPLVLHARTRSEHRCEVYTRLEEAARTVLVTTFFHGGYLLRRFGSVAGRLGLVLICDPRSGPLSEGEREARALAMGTLRQTLGEAGVPLVLAACPERGQDWRELCAGAADVLPPRPVAAAAYPNREALGRAYRVLRDWCGRAGVAELGQGAPVVQALRAALGGDPGMVETAVGVFEELGLAELWSENGQARLMLNPPPEGRLDLARSPSFLEGLAAGDLKP